MLLTIAAILFALSVFCIFISIFLQDFDDEFPFVIVMGIGVISFVIAIFLGSVSFIADGRVEREIVITNETPIVSLTRNLDISGNFVLGTGSIQSGSAYFFYTQDGDDYHLLSVSTDSSFLRESEGAPMYIERESRPTSSFWNWALGSQDEKSIILVPRNTVTQVFDGN